jgi:hypothetical protein
VASSSCVSCTATTKQVPALPRQAAPTPAPHSSSGHLTADQAIAHRVGRQYAPLQQLHELAVGSLWLFLIQGSHHSLPRRLAAAAAAAPRGTTAGGRSARLASLYHLVGGLTARKGAVGEVLVAEGVPKARSLRQA